VSDRPRGLGPCDLLTLEELGAWLRCRPERAAEYARDLGVTPLHPGRWALYCVGDVLEAQKRGRAAPVVEEAPPRVQRARGATLRRAGI
jgi:hypothetical protein